MEKTIRMPEVTNSLLTFDQPYRPIKYRLLNWGGTILRRSGLPLAELREESLLEAAQRLTGLSDFGDEGFRVPLQILLESLDKEANLNFMGRYSLQQYLVRLLVNRLRIQEDFKLHPEIRSVPIKRPLFILGLPRSGTTFLHNLLSQDPSSRWLHLWELFSPSPPPDRQTWETDLRPEEAEKLVASYNSLVPNLSTTHYLNPYGPEECNQLFEHNFVSPLFQLRANVPSYSKWLEKQDLVASYRYYRQQLQLLTWKWPGDHLVLKAPAHLSNLAALIAVFPDACIIHTHRDPLKVIPSICSLCALVRGIYTDRVEPKSIGEYYLNRLVNTIECAMRARETISPEQIYDLNYINIVKDPIGTVHQIYEYFGYDFNTAMEENLNQYISQNPQHKYGIHRYSLDQFGLEPIVVNQKFDNYRKKFNLKEE